MRSFHLMKSFSFYYVKRKEDLFTEVLVLIWELKIDCVINEWFVINNTEN